MAFPLRNRGLSLADMRVLGRVCWVGFAGSGLLEQFSRTPNQAGFGSFVLVHPVVIAIAQAPMRIATAIVAAVH